MEFMGLQGTNKVDKLRLLELFSQLETKFYHFYTNLREFHWKYFIIQAVLLATGKIFCSKEKNSLRIMLMWAHLRFTKWILITLWYKISFKHYRHDDSVENLVEINNLTRDDVNSVLRCRAVNNNISAPVETRILLDIIRKIFSYQPASLKRRRFLLFSFNCHRKLVLIFWQGTGGIVTKLFSTLNMKIIRGFSINSNSWGVIIKIQILWSWVILLNISWKKFCKTCQESFVNKISWSI